jgi:uroporphyrinogen III methyltransferase / synthase
VNARVSESRSLAGRTIVVTRAADQAPALVAALEAHGASVLRMGTIRITDDVDGAAIDRALERLPRYDWVVFTSVNGVRRFWSALETRGMTAARLAGRICAIGAATAAAVAEQGLKAALVPADHRGEGAAAALLQAGVGPGSRVLLARAKVGRAVIPEALAGAGASVDDVAFYRTVLAEEGAEAVQAALSEGRVWAIAFTSPSTVRGFVAALGAGLGGAHAASIGPVTSEALRRAGIPVTVEAAVHTMAGLVEALEHCSRRLG